MNKRLKYFLHIVFWAYMFLSPLTYARGTGINMTQYVMNCMSPLMMMVVFYINYFWLAPYYYAAGKHRYFLLINAVLVISLGIGLHYWTDFTNNLFQPVSPTYKGLDNIEVFFFILRDIINLAIFATAATCIALSQRWYWAEQARNKAEAARTDAELSNLRNQINPHFLLNTLNNIYALTAFDTGKAQEAIRELSNMLRHILYDYQQPAVPLADEVEFIQAIDADEDNIICDIRNSNHPKAASDHSGHGIGLQQIQRRLELAYFEHYTWTKEIVTNGKVYHSRIHITDWKESNSKLKSEDNN